MFNILLYIQIDITEVVKQVLGLHLYMINVLVMVLFGHGEVFCF